MKTRVVWLSVLVVPLVAVTARTAHADWKSRLRDALASESSWERAAGVSSLDPSQAEQLKALFKLAAEEDWFIRSTIAKVLAKTDDLKATAELKKTLASGKGPVAEVVATAFAG